MRAASLFYLVVIAMVLVSAGVSYRSMAKDQRSSREVTRRLFEANSALSSQNDEMQAELDRANRLIANLFGFGSDFTLSHTISYPVKITFYSLSVDECDEDPLTSAFGKSRVFMAALSREAEAVFNLKPGDRFALVSKDGEVRAICEFWDRLNQSIDGLQVDVVSPRKEVAKWYGVKFGHVIKVVGS